MTNAQRAMVDEAARRIVSPDVSLAKLQALYAREEFRIAEIVTSWTSAVEEPPIEVALRHVG